MNTLFAVMATIFWAPAALAGTTVAKQFSHQLFRLLPKCLQRFGHVGRSED
ncbi:MAG: hypothetical protein HN348_23240 [Proteobacteria bacterium]|nr:hypothetical protein [Pseudomonadota bacterium]